MRRTFLIQAAAIVSLMLTTACAGSPPVSASVIPPRRAMPETATNPCVLHRLGENPTVAELETAYVARGVALVACDEARQLAVDVHAGEHADEDRWIDALKPSVRLRLPR